jgi:hypothetical protein
LPWAKWRRSPRIRRGVAVWAGFPHRPRPSSSSRSRFGVGWALGVIPLFPQKIEDDDEDDWENSDRGDSVASKALKPGERDVECLEHKIRIGVGDAHWGLNAERIPK